MILGIDCAMATCGWAVIDNRRARPELIDFGVKTTAPSGVEASTDRSRRIAAVCAELDLRRMSHKVDMIAAEQPLGFGTVHAVIPQALCFGALVMMATLHEIDLAEVRAKEWQPAVLGKAEAEKVNYKHVARALTQYVGDRINSIPANLRTHALDAVGIALYASLRSVTLIVKGARRRAFHEQHQQQETAS